MTSLISDIVQVFFIPTFSEQVGLLMQNFLEPAYEFEHLEFVEVISFLFFSFFFLINDVLLA